MIAVAARASVLRVAIVGAGRIGHLHAGNAAKHPRMKIVSVYDVDRGRAVSLAAHYDARAVDRVEEALSLADAAIVASSTDTHAETALVVARAGKPMYLEKPIDLDFEKARATAAALKELGVQVVIGFNRRFDAAYGRLRADIRQGALGRLQILHMTSRGPNEAPSRDYIAHCGGIYRDKAIHFFDLLRYLTGREVVEVFAQGATHADAFIGEMGDVDTCVVQLRLDDNSLCQIDNTRRAIYGFDERIEVMGTQGLREVGRGRSDTAFADERGVFGALLPSGFAQRFEAAFANAIDGFARYVLDGEGNVPTVDDGIAAQVISEAAATSAREARAVRIGTAT